MQFKGKVIFEQNHYMDKLQDPRWTAKRQDLLDKNCHKCCQCGERHNLQVHHLWYEKQAGSVKWKDPWDYEDEALQVLCSKCHTLRGKLEFEFKKRVLAKMSNNKIISELAKQGEII